MVKVETQDGTGRKGQVLRLIIIIFFLVAEREVNSRIRNNIDTRKSGVGGGGTTRNREK